MSQHPGNALVYEGVLSWQLCPLTALPPASVLAAVNESNDLLLHNVLFAEEKHDKTEYDENDEIMQEFKRQDLKLRLILELLGTLLVQSQLIPAPAPLQFSSAHVKVPVVDDQLFVGESWYECDLYIDPTLPKPLKFFVQPAEGEQEAGWQVFVIHGLRQSVQDGLEKFIFRNHRKVVAQNRKNQAPVTGH